MCNRTICSDQFVLTLSLILTEQRHGRLVLLTVGMVGDVASLLVGRALSMPLKSSSANKS